MTAPNLSTYRHPPAVRRLLRSLVPVICPPDAEEQGLACAIIDHFELTLSAAPPIIRVSFVAGALTYEEGARVWPPARGRRASKLDQKRAARWFQRWWTSPLPPLREFARSVRSLLNLAYYEQPSVKAQIGYQPERWIDRVTRYRLEVYADEIGRQDQALLEADPLLADVSRRPTDDDAPLEGERAG